MATRLPTADSKVKNMPAPIPVEELRERMLRPLPTITARGILIALLVFLVISWAWTVSRPSESNRIDGIGDVVSAMADLIGRMFPAEYEYRTLTGTLPIIGEVTIEGWPLIVSATLETIQMAIIGTLGAVVLAIPVSLLAAKNTSPHPIIYQVVRLLLNGMRSIPELIWAILFVAGVGLGSFTGVLALAFGSVGSMGRIYAEAIEQIDPQQVLAVRATGASGMQAFMYAVIPQALPLLISYTIIYFESNVRHATILGYVGAGGLGYKLFEYTGLGNYQRLMGTIIVLLIAVTIIDRFSSWLRQRFI